MQLIIAHKKVVVTVTTKRVTSDYDTVDDDEDGNDDYVNVQTGNDAA